MAHEPHNGSGYPNGDEKPRLTGKQRAFVDAYFSCGYNATEAAARAGYKGSRTDLAAIGSQNLRKPNILAEINQRWAQHGVTSGEVIARLAEQMRGSMSDFLTIPEHSRIAILDLEQAQERGKLGLVKRVSWTKSGVVIELYDAQRALELIGRTMGLFTDRVETEHTGEVVVRFAKPEE